MTVKGLKRHYNDGGNMKEDNFYFCERVINKETKEFVKFYRYQAGSKFYVIIDGIPYEVTKELHDKIV